MKVTHDDGIVHGAPVIVRDDDGREWNTRTRSPIYTVAGELVVMVDGALEPLALSRVTLGHEHGIAHFADREHVRRREGEGGPAWTDEEAGVVAQRCGCNRTPPSSRAAAAWLVGWDRAQREQVTRWWNGGRAPARNAYARWLMSFSREAIAGVGYTGAAHGYANVIMERDRWYVRTGEGTEAGGMGARECVSFLAALGLGAPPNLESAALQEPVAGGGTDGRGE